MTDRERAELIASGEVPDDCFHPDTDCKYCPGWDGDDSKMCKDVAKAWLADKEDDKPAPRQLDLDETGGA
jgi:hypothetical protein